MTHMPRSTWLLLGSLYTTQFLGLGFLVVALVAIMRDQGATLDQVGMVYMLGMVWPFKVLWAPMIDKIRFGRYGHYRVWLLLMQGGLALVLLAMGFLDVIGDFPIIYLLGALIAFLSASQDIAVDGLACRLLSPDQRGMGNGIQIAGGLLGNMLGGGVVLLTYPWLGWQGSLLLLAAGTSVSFLQVLWYDEPARAIVRAEGATLFRCVAGFWTRAGGRYWLMLLMLNPIGCGLAYAVTIPVLVDRGWGMDRIGLMVNVFGSIAGIVAAFVTGSLLHRFSRRAVLVGAAFFQVPGIAVILVPAVWGFGDGVATLAVILYFLCYNPAATVLATLMMDHASPRRPATDYTFQYSLNMGFAMGAMSLAAALAQRIGYGGVVILGAAVAVLVALLSMGYRSPSSDREGEGAAGSLGVAAAPMALAREKG
ncbi:MAG TPA: MFS transporter, partial [Rhodospirillum rubrum]|nr:MFS transporter [Rhodospirillum rubrum]